MYALSRRYYAKVSGDVLDDLRLEAVASHLLLCVWSQRQNTEALQGVWSEADMARKEPA